MPADITVAVGKDVPTQLIDTKFEVFTVSLLRKLKAEFQTFLKCKKSEIATYIEIKGEIVSEMNNEYSASVKIIQEHLHKKLNEANIKLSKVLDGLQQYVRRQNLRIFGIPLEKNKPKDVREIIKKIV